MRNTVFGIIFVLWGIALLAYGLAHGASGSGAYHTGQVIGFLFGFVLIFVGGRALLRSGS